MRKTITSPEYRNLVSWLKSKRKDQGLSMRALADKLAVPHSFVQKIEMMERRLDVMEYISYCTALGINPKDGLDQMGGSSICDVADHKSSEQN